MRRCVAQIGANSFERAVGPKIEESWPIQIWTKLLIAILEMAEMLLEKQGAFLPIGAIMLSNGEIQHVGAQIEGEEYPGAQPLMELLISMFKKEAAAGRLRAAAMGYDVFTVPPGKSLKQDAICCSLEHRFGDALDVFKPYMKAADGTFQFEEVFAVMRTPTFFCGLPRG